MSGVAPDYEARAMEYGFASKEKILEILLQQGSTAVLLDVRTLEEISGTGKIQVEGVRWVSSSCTPDACPELEVRADEILPNKTGKCFCWLFIFHVNCILSYYKTNRIDVMDV
jgi:hypothetical protein